jgi:hypothetical protein
LSALREADRRAATSGLRRIPTPIAVSLERVGSASMPNVELRLAQQAVEMFLRYAAIVGFSEAEFRGLRGPLPGVPAGRLARPSMGIWNTAVAALRKILPGDSAFAELASCVDSNSIELVVRSRNDIHHGIEPSEGFAQELASAAGRLLTRLTTRAVARVSHVPFLPISLEFGAEGFIASGLRLAGAGLVTQRETWSVENPVPTRVPHILSPSGQAFPLSPWLTAREARAHGQWDILLYEGVKARNARQLTDEDHLLYTDVGSGDAHIQSPGATIRSVGSWFGIV